jgi:aldehyde dehydrogenase (NAD+)
MSKEVVGLVKGGTLNGEEYSSGCYVKPAIAEVNHSLEIVHQETFAPILYLIKYKGDIQKRNRYSK